MATFEWNSDLPNHTPDEAAGLQPGGAPQAPLSSSAGGTPEFEPHQSDAEWAADNGISDMRYSGPADVADESSAPALGAFDFIVNQNEEPALSPEDTAALRPQVASVEPKPAPAPAPIPVPAPVSTPAPVPAAGTSPAPTAVQPIPVTIPRPASSDRRASQGDAAAKAGEDKNAKKESAPKRSLKDILTQPIGKGSKGKGKGGGLSLPKKGGKGDWPSKTSINLYERSKKTTDPRKLIAIGVGLGIAAILFIKFGVIDQFMLVADKQLELTTYKAQATEIESKLGDYQEVKDEYDDYNIQVSATDIDVLGALDMVDQIVKPNATVVEENIEGNILTLALSGASLQTYGNLAMTLNQQARVESVSVQAADNQDSSNSGDVAATMTVTLRTITTTKAVEEALAAPQTSDASAATAGANAITEVGE